MCHGRAFRLAANNSQSGMSRSRKPFMPHNPSAQPVIRGLSHIGIACPDLTASLAFYTGLLGYTEHCRLNYLATGKLMLVCLKISDEQWVELFDGTNSDDVASPLHQIALQIDDAGACRDRLAACGYPVPERVWQGQMRNFGFTTPDPNAITIEFVQATPESWMVRDRGRFLPSSPLAHRIIAAGIPGRVSRSSLDDFYGLALGLTVQHGEDGSWLVPVATSDSCAVCDHVIGEPDAETPWIALQVADLAQAEARLEGNRLRAGWSGTIRREGNRLAVVDPSGIEIHLVERIEDEIASARVAIRP
jgi:catechol 2,3-dioxygenase-like lactoylglutathione lyase family enzyme